MVEKHPGQAAAEDEAADQMSDELMERARLINRRLRSGEVEMPRGWSGCAHVFSKKANGQHTTYRVAMGSSLTPTVVFVYRNPEWFAEPGDLEMDTMRRRIKTAGRPDRRPKAEPCNGVLGPNFIETEARHTWGRSGMETESDWRERDGL